MITKLNDSDDDKLRKAFPHFKKNNRNVKVITKCSTITLLNYYVGVLKSLEDLEVASLVYNGVTLEVVLSYR